MLGHRCSGAAGAGSALGDEGCWGIGAVVQQGQGVHSLPLLPPPPPIVHNLLYNDVINDVVP